MEKFQPFSPLHAAALAAIAVATCGAVRAARSGPSRPGKPGLPTVVDFLGPWPARLAAIFALVAGAMALLMLPWRFARAT